MCVPPDVGLWSELKNRTVVVGEVVLLSVVVLFGAVVGVCTIVTCGSIV
jgi:hypothetical protein